jgi:hypothetical protein
MAALRRLGEEIDVTLYELAFGTVRRGLRKQMKTELRRSTNRLGSRDSQLLEITSFLEVSSVLSLLIFVVVPFGCTCIWDGFVYSSG